MRGGREAGPLPPLNHSVFMQNIILADSQLCDREDQKIGTFVPSNWGTSNT